MTIRTSMIALVSPMKQVIDWLLLTLTSAVDPRGQVFDCMISPLIHRPFRHLFMSTSNRFYLTDLMSILD